MCSSDSDGVSYQGAAAGALPIQPEALREPGRVGSAQMLGELELQGVQVDRLGVWVTMVEVGGNLDVVQRRSACPGVVPSAS